MFRSRRPPPNFQECEPFENKRLSRNSHVRVLFRNEYSAGLPGRTVPSPVASVGTSGCGRSNSRWSEPAAILASLVRLAETDVVAVTPTFQALSLSGETKSG